MSFGNTAEGASEPCTIDFDIFEQKKQQIMR
jgi:hypothetical protein